MSDRGSILIVEDERLVQATLSDMLRTAGFVPTAAGSVAEAGQLIESQTFDLAIVDILLPDGRGIDVCSTLTRDKKVPVLILTAYGDAALVDEAEAAGATAYLVKPVDSRELIAAAENLISRKGRARASTPTLRIERMRVFPHPSNN
jgi:DNA-binding response OmpR family regulator